MRASWSVVALALAPFLANWCAKVLLLPRPFYVQFSDPELIYYFNGLRLLGGQLPIYVHSPGTLVVVLSAVIKGLLGGDPLDPTACLRVGYVLGLLATVGACWLLARGPLSGLGRSAQLLTLGVYFASPSAYSRSDVWSAEMLSFAAGALVIVAAWRLVTNPARWREPLWLGASVGLACSLKMTYLPWLLACGVLACSVAGRRVRGLSIYLAGALAAFVLATLPVVVRYREMFGWLGQVATHAGRYGGGGVGAPPQAELWLAAAELLIAAKTWHLVLAIVVVGVICRALGWRRGQIDWAAHRLALTFGLAFLLGYGLYLKQPFVHYLIPAATASLGLAAVGAPGLASLLGRRWLAGLASLVFLLSCRGAVQDWAGHEFLVGWGRTQEQTLASFVAGDGARGRPARVLYGWRFPAPEFALGFFSAASADLDLSAELAARYPNGGADVFGERRVPAGRDWDFLVLERPAVSDLAPGLMRERLGREAVRLGDWLVLRRP